MSVANIASAFDVLTFFLTTLPKEQLLITIKPLQKALYECISTTNMKVIAIKIYLLLHFHLAYLLS